MIQTQKEEKEKNDHHEKGVHHNHVSKGEHQCNQKKKKVKGKKNKKNKQVKILGASKARWCNHHHQKGEICEDGENKTNKFSSNYQSEKHSTEPSSSN